MKMKELINFKNNHEITTFIDSKITKKYLYFPLYYHLISLKKLKEEKKDLSIIQMLYYDEKKQEIVKEDLSKFLSLKKYIIKNKEDIIKDIYKIINQIKICEKKNNKYINDKYKEDLVNYLQKYYSDNLSKEVFEDLSYFFYPNNEILLNNLNFMYSFTTIGTIVNNILKAICALNNSFIFLRNLSLDNIYVCPNTLNVKFTNFDESIVYQIFFENCFDEEFKHLLKEKNHCLYNLFYDYLEIKYNLKNKNKNK